jgi:hypothetical protein
MAGAAEWFRGPLMGGRLEALDAWMKMTADEIDQYLPDGPSEHNGYGHGWDRVGLEYSGIYHKLPRVTKIEPEGDIDFVTSMTVDDKPQKGKTEPYHKVYTTAKDPDVMIELRDVRWATILGDHVGGAPYKDTPLTRHRNVHLGMVIDAYYLTGDPAYARKAVEMLKIIAWKRTGYTKHHNMEISAKTATGGAAGPAAATSSRAEAGDTTRSACRGFDVLWDALTPEERTMIEHNVVRWGMYEGMAGPLWEMPGFFAAVNREDMPFMNMGKVIDDPAPVKELDLGNHWRGAGAVGPRLPIPGRGQGHALRDLRRGQQHRGHGPRGEQRDSPLRSGEPQVVVGEKGALRLPRCERAAGACRQRRRLLLPLPPLQAAAAARQRAQRPGDQGRPLPAGLLEVELHRAPALPPVWGIGVSLGNWGQDDIVAGIGVSVSFGILVRTT